MQTLTIVIKGKWFDKIAEGTMKTEHRDVSPFWNSRLYDKTGKPRTYDRILFINGYSKKARRLLVEFKGFKKAGNTYKIYIGEIYEGKPRQYSLGFLQLPFSV